MIARFLIWIAGLFDDKPDRIDPCGCKWWSPGTFTPMPPPELCEKHEAEHREWLRTLPPKQKSDDDDFFPVIC